MATGGWWNRAAAAVLMFLLVIAQLPPWSRAAGGAPPAFYDVPADIGRYPTGALVKAERARDLAGPLDGLRATRIMYRSTGVDGQPIGMTGIVFAPGGQSAPPGGWPVVSYAHGTTGVGDGCAPSKSPTLYWPDNAAFVARLVADGFVVVVTDYEGLGVEGLHPYLDLDSEARAVIDAVPAAREVVPRASADWAVVGHSQGGHAALGAGERAAEWQAPGLRFVGTVALAPGSHLSELGPLLDSPDVGWELIAYAAAGIRATNPGFDYADMLTAPLLDEMPRAESLCTIELYTHLASSPAGLRGLRDDWLANPVVRDHFARNEPGQRPSAAPIFLLQGDDDEIVPLAFTSRLAATLCSAGEVVVYHHWPATDHDGVAELGYDEVLAWLGDRFEEVPAPSSCT